MNSKIKGSAWLVIGLGLIYFSLNHVVEQSITAIIGSLIGSCFIGHYASVQGWITEEKLFS